MRRLSLGEARQEICTLTRHGRPAAVVMSADEGEVAVILIDRRR